MRECFDHGCLLREACQLYIRHDPNRVVLLSYAASFRGCDYFTPIKSLRRTDGRRKKYIKLYAKKDDKRSNQNKVFFSKGKTKE